jgi:hypothetical protein
MYNGAENDKDKRRRWWDDLQKYFMIRRCTGRKAIFMMNYNYVLDSTCPQT